MLIKHDQQCKRLGRYTGKGDHMGKPSYEELEHRVRELERLVNMKVFAPDFEFVTRDLIYFKAYEDWSVDFFSKQEIEHLTGYGLEDFRERKIRWLDIVHVEDRNIVQDTVKRGLESHDKYFKAEYRILRKQGEIRWVRQRAFIICDGDGDLLYVRGVLNDVTVQKNMELALESESEIFIWMADHLDDGIYIVSGDYRIKFMNKALIDLVGNQVGEVCYRTFFQRDTPCPWSVIDTMKGQGACLEEYRPCLQEYNLPRLGRTFQVRSFPMRMRDGCIAKLGHLKDVTRTRQLETEIKEFSARHRAIEAAADKADLGIFMVQDIDGIEARFCYVNEAFCHITGYMRSELLARSIADLIHVESLATTLGRYQCRERGETLDRIYDIKMVRKDGKAITVFYTVALSTYDGKLATVGFLQDITERKMVEQALRRSQRLASTGRLAAEIAHEINNPLSSVLTFAKLLSRIVNKKPFPVHRVAELQEFVGHLEGEAGRCANISRNLLEFSRQGELDVKENDVNEILEKILDIMKHRVELQAIEIDTSLASDLPSVFCDFKRLQQVFINIFWNAVEAMPDGGRLRVSTSFDRSRDIVNVKISDTGEGIPEEILERIFEPFVTTKAKRKGAGLGLSVVHGIIRQHQGQVHVRSKVGQGTCFTIELCANKHFVTSLGDKESCETPGAKGREVAKAGST